MTHFPPAKTLAKRGQRKEIGIDNRRKMGGKLKGKKKEIAMAVICSQAEENIGNVF